MKHLILTVLLTSLSGIGFAQQEKIPFEKYGVAEGLPEEYVADLIQDDKGFVWAATQNGLVKYDGYQFKTYKVSSDTSQTTQLQILNLIGGLLKTRDGKIWMGGYTFSRFTLASFDPASEQFRNYNYQVAKGNRFGASLLGLEDSRQNIWFADLAEDKGNKYKVNISRLNQTDFSIKIYPDLMILNYTVPSLNGITAMLDSSFWILDAQYNLKKWNPDSDGFEIIIQGGKSLTAAGNPDTIKWITKSGNNRLLFNGDHTVWVYDSQKQQVIRIYENPKGILAGNIIAAAEDETGLYWLMHKGGNLTQIQPETGSFQTFVYGKGQLAFPEAPETISDALIISHQNKNGIWFQSYESAQGKSFFFYYDLRTENFSFYNNNIHSSGNGMPARIFTPYNFMEDETGLLWLHARPGMYKQAPKKRQLELYRHHLNGSGSLPSDTIHYLFEDSKKRFWVGTLNGLALYQPALNNFLTFRHDQHNSATISHNTITAIVEDGDGNIWVGTANGLNLWQESTKTFKRFFYSPEKTFNCLVLYSDKKQRLWLSVRNKGIYVLKKSTGEILKTYMPDTNNPTALSSTAISTIYQDSNDNIWLGSYSRLNTQAGLFRLNKTEDGFFHYHSNPDLTGSISDKVIFFIAEDGKKRLWIGANVGLNLYDPVKDCFTVFISNTMNCLTGFCIDKSGEPWFGTYSGSGLVYYDMQKKIINAYGESQGLLHNDISLYADCRITVDDFGRFWIPTQRGLSVFDPESKLFVSYFEKDGFQPYDIGYITTKTSNGDVWIGGFKGLNRIVPAELMKKNTTLPSVVITKVTINNSENSIPDGNIFKKSVAYTDDFELKHWQKDISFDFVALHYLRPEDNQYSWKLENYDKEWAVPSKERKASYTNLSPGNYVFKVKASNADGIWNEEGVSIAMTILPPWWQTWWAYLIYVLLILAALRSYSIWRERHLRKEKERLQAKVEERTIELKKSLEEIKSTQAQLIHSEKMASLGALTAGIAHEIQNPLNFVNNFSEISNELISELKSKKEKALMNIEIGQVEIEKDEITEDEILNSVSLNLEKILHHGKRADAIVKGMLLHSRGSNGHREPTDINALCDEYLRLSYHGFRAKDKSFNADFKTEFEPDLPKIHVVPQDIGRVLLNLINNAFYAVHVETQHVRLYNEQFKNRITNLWLWLLQNIWEPTWKFMLRIMDQASLKN
jgi:ligand-binding sensor domain-containing protein/signal transduction histidine kinase